jgi:hypothetical protein
MPIFLYALLFFSMGLVHAGMRDPFLPGFSMDDMGAIFWKNSAAAKQPWQPSCFIDDSAGWGGMLCGIEYFSRWLPAPDEGIHQILGGGWYANRFVGVKTTVGWFDALDTYYEILGYCSIGTSIIPFVSVSVDIQGMQCGLRFEHSEREAVTAGGISVFVPLRYISFAASITTIVLEGSEAEGIAPPAKVWGGLYTNTNRFGAQGVRVEYIFDNATPIRFIIGEELWLHKNVGIGIALSTQPMMVGMGVTATLPFVTGGIHFIHHPHLGWSRGFALMGSPQARRKYRR